MANDIPVGAKQPARMDYLSSYNIITTYSGTSAHNATPEQLKIILHDGLLAKQGTYGTILMYGNRTSFIEFYVGEECKLWATSGAYSDGGGSTGQNIEIHKYDDSNNTYSLYESAKTTSTSDWYILSNRLEKGKYKIFGVSNYIQFNEFYFESLTEQKSFVFHEYQYKQFVPRTTSQSKDTNLVPTMTSNITPIGRATANHEFDPAWGAFDDGKKARSFWFSSDANAPDNQWLQYEFEYAVIVNRVSLQSEPISGSSGGIKDFSILGSNDGVVFDTLFSGVHPNSTSEVFYSFSNKNNYKFYRIKGNSYNSSTQMLINSFKMFGEEIPSKPSYWSTVSSATPSLTQFKEKGMLMSSLDRKVQGLDPVPMNKTEDILDTGDIGFVFSKTIDLKKHVDIRKIDIEVN